MRKCIKIIGKKPLKTTNRKVNSGLNIFLKKKELDEKLFQFLYVKYPRLGKAFLPLKIHK